MSSAEVTPRISDFFCELLPLIEHGKTKLAFGRSSKFYIQHLEWWCVSGSHLKLLKENCSNKKGLFKQLYMLLLYNWLNQNTELILSFSMKLYILPFFTSLIAPHTSNKNTSGKPKSPKAESSASAKSSGLFLSLPASTMVVAAKKIEKSYILYLTLEILVKFRHIDVKYKFEISASCIKVIQKLIKLHTF